MTKEEAANDAYMPTKIPGERPGQAGGKRHQNRLARTRALCEAALKCFLDQGIDAVTIDDVVKAAAMSKGSFYRYFDNKDDLIDALFQPMASAITDAMDTCNAALETAEDAASLELAYGVLAGSLLQVFVEQPDAIRLFLQERHGPPASSRALIQEVDRKLIEMAINMSQAARQNGLLRVTNPKVSALMVVGAIHELLWQHYQGLGPTDMLSSATQLIDYVLRGVGNR